VLLDAPVPDSYLLLDTGPASGLRKPRLDSPPIKGTRFRGSTCDGRGGNRYLWAGPPARHQLRSSDQVRPGEVRLPGHTDHVSTAGSGMPSAPALNPPLASSPGGCGAKALRARPTRTEAPFGGTAPMSRRSRRRPRTRGAGRGSRARLSRPWLPARRRSSAAWWRVC
jgi:hypothetical protein